ncbi:hypothetical protein SDC9_192240 [bioreactor metagenome]|uniref:Uncharacterized protein n=1 Tax=bioreactor metagenome TaxID=1076179 RepID=A0A645I065_9ZZZZ
MPAQTIAILFLNCTGYQHAVFVIQHPKVFHNFSAIYSGYNPAKLIRGSTPSDFAIRFKPFIRIKIPVIHIANANSVNMSVKTDQGIAGSHISQDIPLWVNFHFVKTELTHFFSNGINMLFLITAFARVFHNIAEEFCHILFITLCRFFDCFKIHFQLPPV